MIDESGPPYSLTLGIGRAIMRIQLGALILGAVAYAAIPTGPAVGVAVPNFKAPDQNGALHDLQSLLGPKGGILVFYRSADW